MKIVKMLVLVLLVVIVASLVMLIFWGGSVVKQGVNTVGPRVLGVPVTVEAARFHPLRGEVALSGLFVGNPEGFRTESLFDMRHLEIDLDVKSLFTDTIVIQRIFIDAPQITYEMGLGKSNLGVLLEKLESATDPDAPKKEDAPEEVKLGKAVVIKELILADARAQVSSTAMFGQVVPIQLSTITLNDLGGEDQGLTQIVTEVVKAVFSAVVNAVAGAGDMLGDGLNAAFQGAGVVTGVAADGVRAIGGTAGDGVRGVTGVFRSSEDDDEVEGVVPEGAIPDDLSEKADRAAEKADRAVEKAEEKVQERSSRLSGALGGLLGQTEDEEKE